MQALPREFVKNVGMRAKKRPGMKREEMGRKENLLSPTLPLLSFCFAVASTFGAITRLETLATPANKAQDLTTSND